MELDPPHPNSWSAKLARAAGLLAVCGLAAGLLSRAGMTRALLGGAGAQLAGKAPRTVLRVWDWWSPSTSEQYAGYFAEVEREFERRHPDVDVVYQFVPFGQYEQKMATGLVGHAPPDVFQSSVSFAEGFYDRRMLLPLNPFLQREREERERRRRAGLPVDMSASVDREAFLEAAWRHNTKPDGIVFGIPQILDARALVWNLDLLRPLAQTDPDVRSMFMRRPDGTPDYTRLRWNAVSDWAQFRRVVKKLSVQDGSGQLKLGPDGDPVRAGFALHAHGSGAEPLMPWCAANGSNFQDLRGTRALFADAAGVEAMQFLLDLYWKDHSCPPFRRQMTDDEVFNQGRVACSLQGTWAGKYITRNTDGKLRFDLTAFPPGPRGSGPTTLSWGNMLVISRRAAHPDLAWEYVKFITVREGALRLLRHIQQNSPRKDFYETPDWRRACEERPFLWNVPAICASGKKLRNTQINAVDNAIRPIFESILLHYPEIEKGQGPYPSVEAGLKDAATAVERVYTRYNTAVQYWNTHP